MNTVKPY